MRRVSKIVCLSFMDTIHVERFLYIALAIHDSSMTGYKFVSQHERRFQSNTLIAIVKIKSLESTCLTKHHTFSFRTVKYFMSYHILQTP